MIADRHYNRQKIGAPQFVPPGRCLVLKRPDAFWVTSFPFAQYVKHAWAGAWVCSAFRREKECAIPASELIRDALAATRWKFGDPPELGMVTFLDKSKVKSIPVRGKETWGRTWLLAGFMQVGKTKGGLLAFRIEPSFIPEAICPRSVEDSTASLFPNEVTARGKPRFTLTEWTIK